LKTGREKKNRVVTEGEGRKKPAGAGQGSVQKRGLLMHAKGQKGEWKRRGNSASEIKKKVAGEACEFPVAAKGGGEGPRRGGRQEKSEKGKEKLKKSVPFKNQVHFFTGGLGGRVALEGVHEEKEPDVLKLG